MSRESAAGITKRVARCSPAEEARASLKSWKVNQMSQNNHKMEPVY